MAAVSLLGSTINTTAGAKSVTATPAVGDLIVIATHATDDSTILPPTDDQGGTYSLIQNIGYTNNLVHVYVRDSLIASATSTVFTHPDPGTDTGGGIAVVKITGMSKAGAAALRQVYRSVGGTAGTTPTTPIWSNPKLTSNPVIGVCVNYSNTAGLTPTTGYTEILDTGFNTPTAGVHIQKRDSGDTSTTLVWGGNSATDYDCVGIEFDASALGVNEVLVSTLGAPNFTTTTGGKTAPYLVAHEGDLVVICVMVSDDGTWSAPTDDNSSGTYTQVGTNLNNGFGEMGAMYVRDALIPTSARTIFTLPAPGTDTGGGLAVLRIKGVSKAGSSAVRQSKQASGDGNVAMSTGTWGNARLTSNPAIGFSVSGYLSGYYSAMAGFTLIVDSAYTTPSAVATVQKVNSGNTGDTMTWGGVPGSGYYWACIGVELDASPNLVTEELTAATFGFTANSVNTRKTTNLGAASFGFATLNGQLSWTGQLYAGSLDFTNQPWQQHATNNQGAAALNFTAQNAEPTQVVTLSDAALSMSATDVTFARQNNLGVVAFDLAENVVYAGSRVDLDAAQLKFAENDVVLGRTISLAAAALDMTPYSVAPTAVITLSTATVDNTALDITPSNAPLGTVVDLNTAALGFAAYGISAGSEINLSLALLSFATETQQNLAAVNLSAAALNFTAQDVDVVKDPVVIELTAAAFDFTEYALQAMGVSSIGDRRRILMGVGR